MRRLAPTHPIALPDMRAVALDLVVEGVIDGDLVVPVAVDCVGEQLEAGAVAGAVVAAGVGPRGGEEEVGVDGFVQEGVDCVGARAVLE